MLVTVIFFVSVALFLFLVAFDKLMHVFLKGKATISETDTERRIRELKLPMRKKWQRSS